MLVKFFFCENSRNSKPVLFKVFPVGSDALPRSARLCFEHTWKSSSGILLVYCTRHQNEYVSCNCTVLVTENAARSEIWWNECYIFVICLWAKQLLIGNAEWGVLSQRKYVWRHSSGLLRRDFFSATFQNVLVDVSLTVCLAGSFSWCTVL